MASVTISTPEEAAEALAAAEAAVKATEGEPVVVAPVTEEVTPPVEGEEPPKVVVEGEQKLEIPKPGEVPAEIAGQLDMEALTVEYAENGKLGEESEAKVLKVLADGFGEAAAPVVLQAYLAGVDSQVATLQTNAFEAAGGQEAFNAQVAWASTNLTPAQVDAFNVAVNDPNFQQLAVSGLRAQFEAAGGVVAPAAETPDTSRVSPPAVTSAGVSPITSQRQLADLVSTDKYANDAGHRAAVDAQIVAASRAGTI